MIFEMEKSLKNKRILQAVLIFLSVAVVAAGITIFTTMRSGSGSASAAGTSGTPMESVVADDTQAHADELYKNLVSDAGDSAAVAKLLETMGLESSVGKYKVTVDQSGKNYVLTVDISETVKAEDREAFDAAVSYTHLDVYKRQVVKSTFLHGSPGDVVYSGSSGQF